MPGPVRSSPAFVHAYDLLQWVLGRTQAYPRSFRASLGRRIQERTFDLYESLLAATDNPEPVSALRRADRNLAALRTYLRLSRDLNLLSLEQYAHGAQACGELGRLIGGWLRRAVPR